MTSTLYETPDRAITGKNAKEAIHTFYLPLLKKTGIITDFTKFQTERPAPSALTNMTRKDTAPFIISFENDERWAILVAKGNLKDRLKEKYWDAELLKKHANVTKCYLVNVSDENINQIILNANKQIQELLHYEKRKNYFLDGVISESDFFWLTLEKYLERYTNNSAKGSKRGTAFEKCIAAILCAKDNIIKWNNTKYINGFQYILFEYIISFLLPEKPYIKSIKATTDIPPLENNIGKPKTDICIDVEYSQGTSYVQKRFTISCKASPLTQVSVHEYDVDSYIYSLGLDLEKDKQFIDALRVYQRKGSWKAIEEDPSLNLNEIDEIITNGFSNRYKRLCEWVVKGKYGMLTEPDIQIANYLITVNPQKDSNGYRTICIETADDYISKIIRHKKFSHGIPFGWSQNNGNIQLKMSILSNQKNYIKKGLIDVFKF